MFRSQENFKKFGNSHLGTVRGEGINQRQKLKILCCFINFMQDLLF